MYPRDRLSVQSWSTSALLVQLMGQSVNAVRGVSHQPMMILAPQECWVLCWALQHEGDRDKLERHHRGPPRVWSISHRKGS